MSDAVQARFDVAAEFAQDEESEEWQGVGDVQSKKEKRRLKVERAAKPRAIRPKPAGALIPAIIRVSCTRILNDSLGKTVQSTVHRR